MNMECCTSVQVEPSVACLRRWLCLCAGGCVSVQENVADFQSIQAYDLRLVLYLPTTLNFEHAKDHQIQTQSSS